MKRAHGSVPLVRVVDELADDAAAIVRTAFPTHLKALTIVPGVHTTAISRARAGCRSNPLFRAALWILAAHRAGMPRDSAQLLADWLDDVVERCWHAAQVDVASATTRAMQVAYGEGDETVRPIWIAQLRRERAAMTALICALEDEERARTERSLLRAA